MDNVVIAVYLDRIDKSLKCTSVCVEHVNRHPNARVRELMYFLVITI